ncbi:LytR/AlgR family response regulator transcription factor [Pontibacter cellulosilyticus]|uniref:Response regulator transcription factor n=1 Tax=Pontibacter cellulosilyticus TaxID=1720253 RepID=A0A923SKC4_9BACT|nr:LytTR family DNA-binding domain-containing protein [Pontibacter cellulosilyticus]MBC5993641.1 response regulator transcription factor [Pontibacter cellulosilyticus]
MKVLIVEDEQIAARTLQNLILKLEPQAEIIDIIPTVKKTTEFLQSNPDLDLIFFDIHLADGSVFKVFEEVIPQAPVVFTTAYDAYAVKAFELNSLDYLLKPIRADRLQQTLVRFKQQRETFAAPVLHKLQSVLQGLQQPQEKYKSRFLVKAGSKLLPIEVEQVAYFYRDDEVVQLMTFEGKRYSVNYSLEELDGTLNPTQFFRLNRQTIANFHALAEIHSYFKGKLKIELKPAATHEVIVSQERASDFKEWLEGERQTL